jgi:hypothetical protein
LEKETKNASKMSDEAVLSANILATEASIDAKLKQLALHVQKDVGAVVDKVHGVGDMIGEVKDAVNIKKHIDESPLKMLAIAAVAGLFAGGILSRKSSHRINPSPVATGPGLFSLLAIGILRPVITELVLDVAKRSLNHNKNNADRNSMNGSHINGHLTH